MKATESQMSSPTWLIKARESFSAAHHLVGYQGKCARQHGHNWQVELACQVSNLDGVGIGVDFGIIKCVLQGIINQLDHFDLNEQVPVNPTAELLAQWVYQQAQPKLSTLVAVSVWETEHCVVTYTP